MMDIAAVSMALAQIKTQSDVGTAVLNKAMDTQQIIGDGVVQMINKSAMELSVNPAVGANVDVYA